MPAALAHGSMPATPPMTHCLVVQHVEPEPAWAIADALVRAGIELDIRRTFAGDPVPPHCEGVGAVVVMGGPASAATDEGFPSRRAELALLSDALHQGIPTLGVCLGAQLLALAAGARVYPAPDGPEIGWGPIALSPPCADDPLLHGLPPRLTVLHWHGDTFDLPPGASHLARSPRSASQAFRAGPVAWGFQFHMEVTAPAVEGLTCAFPADAARATGGATAIRRGTSRALESLGPWRELVFDRFAALVSAGLDPAAPDGSPRRFVDISES